MKNKIKAVAEATAFFVRKDFFTMARFCSLFSSSSGNSTFIGSAKTGILIDAGVSTKRLKEALLTREIDPASIAGIFITHEHSDHIKGMRILASTYRIPVYGSEGTITALEEIGQLTCKFPYGVIGKDGMEVGDLFIKPFSAPHDAAECYGYRISLPDGQNAAIATDTGHISNEIMTCFSGCQLVMMESNHDVNMLRNGPYPYHLKRRILSDKGHLSNEDCAKTVTELLRKGTTRFFLGHLSTENNFPDLAYEESHSALTQAGAVLSRDYLLEVNKKENDCGIIRF